MSSDRPAAIARLYRYPVKGLSAEPLEQVDLRPGQTLPADRRYAIENGPSGFDPQSPGWMPKTQFLMLMRNERLAALQTDFDDERNLLTIRQHGQVVAAGDLETAQGRGVIEAFLAENFAGELKGCPRVLRGRDHSFSDVAHKVVSIINLASLHAIEDMVGVPVDPVRFRANLYLEGWPAWHEAGLVGKVLAAGKARLKVVKTISRCDAFNVDPQTAQRDLDIPNTLMRHLGHNECGIYAEVIAGGRIALGDQVALEEPRLV